MVAMKRIWIAAATGLVTCVFQPQSLLGHETAIYDRVDLCGAWEMSYVAKQPKHASPAAVDEVLRYT